MHVALRESLAEEPATRSHRRTFFVIAAALIAVAASSLAFADLPLAPLPSFMPAYASAVIITDLITAYLILTHAPLSGRISMLWLGAAYLYSGVMVTLQILVFPGVWSQNGLLGAGPQSAVWLWVMWHGGFPAFLILAMAAAWLERRRGKLPRLTIWHSVIAGAFTLSLVTVLGVVAIRGHQDLPVLISNGSYLALSNSIYGTSVMVVSIVALALVVLITRCRTVMDLGLAIAALAATIDALLTLHAGVRFSLGWYIARVCTVVSAFSVLAVYLREVTWLYARVMRLNARLEEQASIDDTTGLYNRRHFNRQLEAALREGTRRREPTSLLLVDIDHFKLYNDHYGHLTGDVALRKVAGALEAQMRRPLDVAARFGGEEFAIILPATDVEGAMHMARRILAAIHALNIEHKASPTAPCLTVSIGMGTGKPGISFEDLIRRADTVLYAAKAAGRDRAA